MADGNCSHHRGGRGHIGAAVADLPAGRQGLDVRDPAVPAQGRLQGQIFRVHLVAGVQ